MSCCFIKGVQTSPQAHVSSSGFVFGENLAERVQFQADDQDNNQIDNGVVSPDSTYSSEQACSAAGKGHVVKQSCCNNCVLRYHLMFSASRVSQLDCHLWLNYVNGKYLTNLWIKNGDYFISLAIVSFLLILFVSSPCAII